MRISTRCVLAASSAAFCVVFALATVGASTARAQSADDLQAAGQAFQEGQRAQVRGDFAQAAELFDLANHTAPNAAALRASMRMHQSAGHHATAATRAAQALASYPNDAPTIELANEVIATCGSQVGRVVVRCEPACGLALGGRVVSANTTGESLYVEPGTHLLRANWGTSGLERSFEATAGGEVQIELAQADAPASTAAASTAVAQASVEPEPITSPEDTTAPGTRPIERTDERWGISPVFVAIAGGLTIVSAAVAVGLGIDMLGARDRYVFMPTEAGWRDGVGRETITNAMIGTSIGLAAVTFVLALVTDWGGPSAEQARAVTRHVQVSASPYGATGQLTLPF